MKVSILLLFISFFIVTQSDTCNSPSTIFKASSLKNIFNSTLSDSSYNEKFFDFLSDPTLDTFKTYAMTHAGYFIPLWVFSGLSFLFFIGCIVQLCCFNCCGMK